MVTGDHQAPCYKESKTQIIQQSDVTIMNVIVITKIVSNICVDRYIYNIKIFELNGIELKVYLLVKMK